MGGGGEEGKQAGERNLTILPSNNVYFFFLPDLKAFIQFVTGSPVAVGRVSVTFDDSMDSQAISANTCGRQLVLSSHIDNKEMFISAMAAIVPEVSFTMP